MTKTKPTNRPTHRIRFARIIGKDEQNKDILGSAQEIGAVWPRAKGGGIVRFDHIPVELTRHQGVLFLSEVPATSSDERGFA